MVKVLSQHKSIIDQIIYELRSVTIQNDRSRFRNNVKKFGTLAGYEISKSLQYTNVIVETPLGEANAEILTDQIVVCPILRAGLPLHDGLMDIFTDAESAFISAYRKHHHDGSFEIYTSYITCPDLNDKVLIIGDPMLATGSSIHQAIEALLQNGTPKKIVLLSVISSKQGLEFIQRMYPNMQIWVGVVDDELTAKAYIVPGLGDAGDLSFGCKLQD